MRIRYDTAPGKRMQCIVLSTVTSGLVPWIFFSSNRENLGSFHSYIRGSQELTFGLLVVF